jgi:hypothetical protein
MKKAKEGATSYEEYNDAVNKAESEEKDE